MIAPRARLAAVFAACCLASAAAIAQEPSITLPLAPKPNQTLRTRITQQMDIEMSTEGGPPPVGAFSGPIKMEGTIVIDLTQTVAAAEPDGAVRVEVKYEDVKRDIRMNGSPMPQQGGAGALAGMTGTIVFNRDGTIRTLDFGGLGAAGNAVGQFMQDFVGTLKATLALGETMTTPYTWPMPIPLPGAPPTVEGRVTSTFVSLETVGGERIARIDRQFEGTIATTDPATAKDPAQPNIAMKMGGRGQMRLNLDRGVPVASEAVTTIDGLFGNLNPASGQSTAIWMHGTITMKMEPID